MKFFELYNRGIHGLHTARGLLWKLYICLVYDQTLTNILVDTPIMDNKKHDGDNMCASSLACCYHPYLVDRL